MHEMVINFTEGFSHHIIWGWMIGVYLVLAGMSGGALIIMLLRRYYLKKREITPLYKAAALIGFGTIAFGMVFLVADLHRPLYFWKILIHYNFKSVMSIGVAAISLYIPLTLLVFLIAFEKEIKDILEKKIKISFLSSIMALVMKILHKFRVPIEATTVLFAIIICAYTGFLISVLVRFPLLNTAVLPALFVASGLAAGGAATAIVAKWFFEKDDHSNELSFLHKLEWPVMFMELLLIVMLVVSLLIGNEYQKIALQAFDVNVTSWAYLFWVGVVGTGFGIPLALNFLFGHKVAHSSFTLYTSGIAGIIGVLCLRLFLLYAGQTFGA